jgi:hypothetical protein
VVTQIANLIPKLRPADRDAVRRMLDEADHRTRSEEITKFFRLTSFLPRIEFEILSAPTSIER